MPEAGVDSLLAIWPYRNDRPFFDVARADIISPTISDIAAWVENFSRTIFNSITSIILAITLFRPIISTTGTTIRYSF